MPTHGDSFDAKLRLQVLSAVRHGDFSVRLPVERIGLNGKIADAFNDSLDMNDRLARGTERQVEREHPAELGTVDGGTDAHT